MWAIIIFLITLIICITVLLYKLIDSIAEAGDSKEIIKRYYECKDKSRMSDKQPASDTAVYNDNDFCATYEEDFLQ